MNKVTSSEFRCCWMCDQSRDPACLRACVCACVHKSGSRLLNALDYDLDPQILSLQVHHFHHLDNQPEPTPLVTPPQSSDEEEVTVRRLRVCHVPHSATGSLTCVPLSSRTGALTSPLPAARFRHPAQLGSAQRHLGNTRYALRSRLQGNSPTTPPSRPPRALPPFPAICLRT